MIQFYTLLTRPNLEYIVSIKMYQDRHFQTGDYPRNQVRIMRKLQTVMKTERI